MKRINISHNLKIIASNTFYQLISKFISMTVTFGLSIFISMKYGSEGYGLFSILQSLPALFYIIADFGLNAISAREIAKDTSKTSDVFSNVLFLRLVISIVGVVLCLIAGQYLYTDERIRWGLALGSLIIITQSLIMTTNMIFQIKLKYDLSTISNTLGYLFILGVSYYLILNKVEIEYINFTYVLGGVVTLIINLYLIYSRFFKFNYHFDRKYLKFLTAESWPLGLMFLFSQINFRADSIFLSFLPLPSQFGSNLNAVGVYAFPYKIFEVILVVPTFMMNSSYPLLLEKFNQDKVKFKAFFKKTLNLFLLVGFISTFFTLIFSEILKRFDIINIYFNSEFQRSPEILSILSFGLVFFFLSQPIAWIYVIYGKQKLLPLVYLIASIFNVSMNYLLIPKYGFIASAYLTWSSELIILLILYFTARIKNWI
jgi:O-antigen/teichoic acid export membrane protein